MFRCIVIVATVIVGFDASAFASAQPGQVPPHFGSSGQQSKGPIAAPADGMIPINVNDDDSEIADAPGAPQPAPAASAPPAPPAKITPPPAARKIVAPAKPTCVPVVRIVRGKRVVHCVAARR